MIRIAIVIDDHMWSGNGSKLRGLLSHGASGRWWQAPWLRVDHVLSGWPASLCVCWRCTKALLCFGVYVNNFHRAKVLKPHLDSAVTLLWSSSAPSGQNSISECKECATQEACSSNECVQDLYNIVSTWSIFQSHVDVSVSCKTISMPSVEGWHSLLQYKFNISGGFSVDPREWDT